MNKFSEIYLDLEADILNQRYRPGELLPSENKLAMNYNVSRETIRKALVLLLESGYIQKQQGKGSIVLDVERFNFPVSGLTSYKELQQTQHIKGKTILTVNQRQLLPEHVTQQLDLPIDTEVHYIERQRQVDGESVILDKDYLVTSIIPQVPDKEAENSLYHYIEEVLGLTIGYAQKEFTVEPITKEDKLLMDLHNDSHVVVVRSSVYLEDTRFFQYTESRHRLDKFRFVDFARRKTPESGVRRLDH
ncbi:trehalose operon repressor [Desemzia sp. RIT804]|uniref:trehalose operon repressor n=1 Tax=Desemzia sp. RIT 804 TaxID=2810209 RepID=UPI001952855D|nr:trehalose operon repressor [Desemzia sp. RIT 804]MBM6615819.1 trehalose operon repressor [Desemzia sp. RIT 804]